MADYDALVKILGRGGVIVKRFERPIRSRKKDGKGKLALQKKSICARPRNGPTTRELRSSEVERFCNLIDSNCVRQAKC